MTTPMHHLPVTATCPEQQQLHGALGLWRNAVLEYNSRVANLNLVVPDQQAAEEAFLESWSDQLDVEIARLITRARDLQARQIAAGELIPQADGTFLETEAPVSATEVAGKIGIGAAKLSAAALDVLEAFLKSKFRTKLGIVALALTVAAFATSGSDPETAASLGIGAIVLGLIWFFAALSGDNPKTHARPAGGDSSLIAARAESQRQADEAARAAVERAAEQKAAAESRRLEALDRARQRAAQTDDDGWD